MEKLFTHTGERSAKKIIQSEAKHTRNMKQDVSGLADANSVHRSERAPRGRCSLRDRVRRALALPCPHDGAAGLRRLGVLAHLSECQDKGEDSSKS